MPRVLDLFSGCGGFSLGFHAAGCEVVGAVELDRDAVATHAVNFFGESGDEPDGPHSKQRNIVGTEPFDLIRDLGYADDPESTVDIIIGGPPCQAFARVGRAKLREVARHPDAWLKDSRGDLYLRYVHYVRELKPLAVIMENVPDILNYGGHNIAGKTCETLADAGYRCRYTILNSVFYGVPQMRQRMFLIALASEVGEEPEFPRPTHWKDLPPGYHGSRQMVLNRAGRANPGDGDFFMDPPEPRQDGSVPAVTAFEAMGDLPEITDHLRGVIWRGARHFTELACYPADAPVSVYARHMRRWPGFENREGVYDQITRSLPRDYAIFRRMRPGDEYPRAHEVAMEILNEVLLDKRQKGNWIPEGSSDYARLKKRIVPPYDPGKFPNKWRKMEKNEPARTLTAHLGKDSYTHIHYDSEQARTISVREAARLQSFPDGFVFRGSMNSAFRQIGNAVPPLVSRALAEMVVSKLGVVDWAQERSGTDG